jgi:hypothetical protein
MRDKTKGNLVVPTCIDGSDQILCRHNVSSSYGRWPSILGNVVVMNSNTFLYAVKRAMDRLPLVNILNLALTQQQQVNSTNSTGPPPPTPTPLAAALVSTDETPLTDSLLDMRLQDYAFAVYVQFQNREEIYSSSFKCAPRYGAQLIFRRAHSRHAVKCASSWPKCRMRWRMPSASALASQSRCPWLSS